MTKRELMENSMGKMVRVIDVDGDVAEGRVILYEDEIDNEDDTLPEPSITVYSAKARDGWLLYESEIRELTIL